MSKETMQLPVMHTRAALEPSTFNEEARTVELVWTTGAAVRRRSWDGDYMEELSTDANHVRLDRLNSGAPLLDSHDNWNLSNIIGVVERAWMDGAEGRAVVRFSEREDLAPVIADVRAGVIRNVSVGYRVHAYQVDESDAKVPTYRAIDWEPMELSLVAIPADAGAQVRAGSDTYPCLIERAQQALNPEEVKMTVKTEENRAAEQPAPQAAPNLDDVRKEAAKAERERADEIGTICRKAKLDEEFARKLVTDGATVDQARAAVIDAIADRDEKIATDSHRATRVEAGETDGEKFVRGAAEALVARSGGGKADGANEFRGLRLLDFARMSLERAGIRTAGMDVMTLVGRAFTQTSSDFPVLLENAMHKRLQSAYAVQPDTWSRFCATGSVSDFRAHNRYRLGSFGNLQAVNEAGEFQTMPIPDGEKASITAGTKGNIINITRQAIINDDLGAFLGFAAMLGRAARRTIEADVYAVLGENSGLGPTMSDSKALFHTDHGNIGTGAAISVESIDADRVLMASQKDVSGNDYLDLRPSSLVLPVGLGGTARVINEAQYDPDTANKLQRPNKVVGLLREIVDTPRLSGTRRYMFADPSEAPVLEVAFLDGQQEPFLEMQQGFSVDGSQWKVRVDYGIAAIDYRGAVTNAGV